MEHSNSKQERLKRNKYYFDGVCEVGCNKLKKEYWLTEQQADNFIRWLKSEYVSITEWIYSVDDWRQVFRN